MRVNERSAACVLWSVDGTVTEFENENTSLHGNVQDIDSYIEKILIEHHASHSGPMAYGQKTTL